MVDSGVIFADDVAAAWAREDREVEEAGQVGVEEETTTTTGKVPSEQDVPVEERINPIRPRKNDKTTNPSVPSSRWTI